MSKIFISYRRQDSRRIAERLDDKLKATFGEDEVFRDVNSLKMGADFPTELAKAIDGCKVMLVLIGRSWLTVKNKGASAPRLFELSDFVRQEISLGLKKRKKVVPVLIHPARMPQRTELPRSIDKLSKKQAFAIAKGSAFENSVHRLVDEIEEFLGEKDAGGGEPPWWHHPVVAVHLFHRLMNVNMRYFERMRAWRQKLKDTGGAEKMHLHVEFFRRFYNLAGALLDDVRALDRYDRKLQSRYLKMRSEYTRQLQPKQSRFFSPFEENKKWVLACARDYDKDFPKHKYFIPQKEVYLRKLARAK